MVIIENGQKIYNGTVSDAATTVEGDLSRIQITSTQEAQVIVNALQAWRDDVKATVKDAKVTLVEYHNQQVKSSDIIAHLVKNDIQIEEAAKISANLEDVFMSLTKGGIS